VTDTNPGQAKAHHSLVPPADWLASATPGSGTTGWTYCMVVTGLALLLRLIRLDGMSLWIDEIFTHELVAPGGPGDDFVARILDAYQGPLYHAAVWPLLRLQDSAFMLRLPSALAGTLAVPLLGMFTARLWGRQSGRLAALLLALSPFAIWYSQEARGYSFMILFAVAAGLVLLAMMDEGPTLGRSLGLALLIFGGLGSNFSFVFLALAFGLTVLLVAPPRNVRSVLLWALALGGGCLLAAPWMLKAAGIWEVGRVVPGVATGEALRGETTFNVMGLPFTAFALFYGFSLGPSLGELHGPDRLAAVGHYWPIIALGVLVALAAILPVVTRLQRRRWPVLLWIVIPLLGVILLAMRNIKPYNVRYAAAAFPWVLALTAAGVARYGRRGRIIVSVALILLFAVSLGGYYFEGRYAKADVRGAVEVMAEAGAPHRPVLVTSVGPVVRYYHQESGIITNFWDAQTLQTPAQADSLIVRSLVGQDTAWVLWVRSWFADPRHLLPGALERHGDLVKVHEGPGYVLDIWHRQGSMGAGGTP